MICRLQLSRWKLVTLVHMSLRASVQEASDVAFYQWTDLLWQGLQAIITFERKRVSVERWVRHTP